MSKQDDKPIAQFDGLVYKVSTLAAGGFRITLDGTSQDIAQAAFLMPFADTPGALVRVTFERVLEKTLTDLDDETTKKTEGSDPALDSGRIAIRRNK